MRVFERRRHAVASAFIPQYFAPGEAYQFDFSHEHVELGGVDQVVKLAHVRLCHSRAFFLVAYPRESQEMVFDAHARAFTFFGGVPRRGIYDFVPGNKIGLGLNRFALIGSLGFPSS
jgi:transposase